MRIIVIPILAILAGCASTTGVVSMGKDTYMVAREDNSLTASLGAIKAETLKDASAFCGAKGEGFEVVSANDVPRSLGQFPQTQLQFKCAPR